MTREGTPERDPFNGTAHLREGITGAKPTGGDDWVFASLAYAAGSAVIAYLGRNSRVFKRSED